MPQPYGTREQLNRHIGSALAQTLTSFAGSTEASDVYARARADADAEIDAALAPLYAIATFDPANVPAQSILTTISNHLTAANLFRARHAEGIDIQSYIDAADRLLARIVDQTYDVPGATKRSGEEATAGVAASTRHVVTGVDASGCDLMSEW